MIYFLDFLIIVYTHGPHLSSYEEVCYLYNEEEGLDHDLLFSVIGF